MELSFLKSFFFFFFGRICRTADRSCPSVADLSGEGLSIQQVLRALAVLAAKVEPDLLQTVTVSHRATRNIDQMLFI